MSTTIGARIQSRRKELKMGADELAQKIGKSKATLYRYENGDIENVPLDILKPIAEALEVSPAYLMGWKEPVEGNEKEKPITNDGLSEKRKALIEFAQSVPEDKAEMILRVMKSIVEAD